MPCLKHLSRSLRWFFLQLVILMGLNAESFSQLLRHWVFTVWITLIHIDHQPCISIAICLCSAKEVPFFFSAGVGIIQSFPPLHSHWVWASINAKSFVFQVVLNEVRFGEMSKLAFSSCRQSGLEQNLTKNTSYALLRYRQMISILFVNIQTNEI